MAKITSLQVKCWCSKYQKIEHVLISNLYSSNDTYIGFWQKIWMAYTFVFMKFGTEIRWWVEGYKDIELL